MPLLSNIEIGKRIFEKKEIIMASPDGRVNFDRQLIQPASIDVTVGEIFLPPAADDDREEVIPFKDHFTLKRGHAVLVRSQQQIKLPASIGGFVFPKNGHFALKGILITNFGHIDPGFEGHLKFTVINMGRNEFSLSVGTPIACVVLFDLSSPANPDWKGQSRHETDNYASHAKMLSRDFMDIRETLRKLTEEQVNIQLHRRERLTFWLTILTSLVGTVFAMTAFIWALIYPFVQTSYDKLINTNVEVGKLQAQVELIKQSGTKSGSLDQ